MPSDHPKVIGPSPLLGSPAHRAVLTRMGLLLDHLDKQPTTRTSEPGPPMCLQAMPSAHPKVIGPSPRENSPGLPCFPGSVSNLQVGLENEKVGELSVAKHMHRELFQKQSKQKGTPSSRDDARKILEPNGTKAKHWSDPGSSSTCVGGGIAALATGASSGSQITLPSVTNQDCETPRGGDPNEETNVETQLSSM